MLYFRGHIIGNKVNFTQLLQQGTITEFYAPHIYRNRSLYSTSPAFCHAAPILVGNFNHLISWDHGDGFMTLYGHNESVYKDTGEWVESGEVIASVGDSGGQNRTGLYFEIRQDGKPVNPVKWCANGKPRVRG